MVLAPFAVDPFAPAPFAAAVAPFPIAPFALDPFALGTGTVTALCLCGVHRHRILRKEKKRVMRVTTTGDS